MLRKHDDLRSERPRNVNITQHPIEVITGALHFKSALYRAGTKNVELDQFEIDKELKGGVIEHSVSEWAAPILWDPKKDGRLRPILTRLISRTSTRCHKMEE